MAKAITFTPQPSTPEERLAASLQDSTPALEDSLKLLRELHEHGVLTLLVKLVRGGEGLGAATLHLLDTDSGVRVLRNLIELVKILDGVESHDIKLMGEAISTGLGEGSRAIAAGKKVNVIEAAALMRDEDVQLALGAMLSLLKGLGRAMREGREGLVADIAER